MGFTLLDVSYTHDTYTILELKFTVYFVVEPKVNISHSDIVISGPYFVFQIYKFIEYERLLLDQKAPALKKKAYNLKVKAVSRFRFSAYLIAKAKCKDRFKQVCLNAIQLPILLI